MLPGSTVEALPMRMSSTFGSAKRHSRPSEGVRAPVSSRSQPKVADDMFARSVGTVKTTRISAPESTKLALSTAGPAAVGATEGMASVGAALGAALGIDDGEDVGSPLGERLGSSEGDAVGGALGAALGAGDGGTVGG